MRHIFNQLHEAFDSAVGALKDIYDAKLKPAKKTLGHLQQSDPQRRKLR